MGLNKGQLLATRLHAAVYRATNGRLGGTLGHIEQVLLTTPGRTSGLARTTPLAATRDGARIILIASNNGGDRHPAWYLNLVAHPEVVVQLGGQRIAMVARVVEGEEREQGWRKAVAMNPGYARYEARTSRRIPVIVCEPAPAPA